MTRGCIEYYFLLHYEKCAPAIHIPADKDKVIELLKKQCPKYKKGDKRILRHSYCETRIISHLV